MSTPTRYKSDSLVGMPVGIFHSGILIRAELLELHPNGALFMIGDRNPHPWLEGDLVFLSRPDFIATSDLDQLDAFIRHTQVKHDAR